MTERHYGILAIPIGIGAALFGSGLLYATYNPVASAFIGQYLTWLIAMTSAVHTKDVQQEPIAKRIGIRANKVQVLNERDCIKVKPKSWLDRKDWREIHDILRVQGFNWLASGKDSCWIKLNQ